MQRDLFLYKIVKIYLSSLRWLFVLKNAQIMPALPACNPNYPSQNLCNFAS